MIGNCVAHYRVTAKLGAGGIVGQAFSLSLNHGQPTKLRRKTT